MRVAALLVNDMRHQARHGFYGVYALVSTLYVVVLRLLPSDLRELLGPVVIFSDPAVIGLFMVAVYIMLERGDGSLDALFTTPARLGEYLVARVASIGLMASASALVIALFGVGLDIAWATLLATVFLTACFFVLVGVIIAARFRVFNHAVFAAGLAMPLFFAPGLAHFGVVESPLFWILPTHGSLRLMASAMGGTAGGAGQAAMGLGVLVFWIGVAYVWAHRWLRIFVLEKAGGSQ